MHVASPQAERHTRKCHRHRVCTKKEDLQESETLPLSFVENDHLECDLAIESALVYQEYRDQRPL